MGYENSGRRPKPTALKVLRGNPGKRPLNQYEPKPPDGEVVKPSGLSPGASAVWDELAPICLAMKTLTIADAAVFRSMCELQATMREASANKDGLALFQLHREKESDPEHLTIDVSDVLRLERESATALRPYYALFGLEPVSRARIQVPKDKPEEPVSKWAGALK